MSAKIILDNIIVKNNPSKFTDIISFEVTFTCLQPLAYPLSWKIIYVGSALNEDYDQVLEQFQIPAIQSNCTSKFEIQCDHPDATKIPRNQLLCVTALILTASYKNQEFIRVGYYVHNQLIQEPLQMEQDNEQVIPLEELVSRIKRTIISDKPRFTKFNIDWSDRSSKKKEVQDSQSRLDDFFSIQSRSKKDEEDSNSQKIKFSTHIESEPMPAE